MLNIIRSYVVFELRYARNTFLSSPTASNVDLQVTEISHSVVKDALDQLKKGKSDGSSICYRHPVLSAKSTLHYHYQTWLCFQDFKRLHTRLSPNLERTQLFPKIIDPCIALCPTLSKFLEWCISFAVYSPHLLFSLASNQACQLTCTGLVKNVIACYCFNGSYGYGCFLDGSIAFDRVCHLTLFNKLLERNLPLLLDCSFPGTVIRNPEFSGKNLSEVYVSNGVRQGGVLSRSLH